jgi:hypothetical protein
MVVLEIEEQREITRTQSTPPRRLRDRLIGELGLDDRWRDSSALLPIPKAGYAAGLAAHRNMLTLRLRSINHTEATAAMLSEPAPRASRG